MTKDYVLKYLDSLAKWPTSISIEKRNAMIELIKKELSPKHAGFSMDGLRIQMTHVFEDLHENIANSKDQLYKNDANPIMEKMDELASLIGMLCCTYNNDFDTYNLLEVDLPLFDNDEEDDE